MVDSGKASKSAINGVIKDISDYTTIVSKELELIMREAESLSDVWRDRQFRQFIERVEMMKIAVESELNTINRAKHELEKKVDMM